jgi:hypothetical protein
MYLMCNDIEGQNARERYPNTLILVKSRNEKNLLSALVRVKELDGEIQVMKRHKRALRRWPKL